jgi:phosphoglycolate phosphatase
MTIRGVLFDLDGTLVDTAPDLVAVLNVLLARRQAPPVPYAIGRNEVSNGALGLIRLGFGSSCPEEQIEALRQEFLEIYTSKVCVNSKIFNKLYGILNAIDDIGACWGIVTNKPHAMTEPLLDALGILHWPRCIISGDRLPERKPHPAPLQLAARELGMDGAQCVYVGDAPRDIEAGRAAGMATIAAAYGYIRASEQPERWGADLVIRRPTELLGALERLNQERVARGMG